jgi:hypothetical protein
MLHSSNRLPLRRIVAASLLRGLCAQKLIAESRLYSPIDVQMLHRPKIKNNKLATVGFFGS